MRKPRSPARSLLGCALLAPAALAGLSGCGGDDPIDEPQPLYGGTPVEYPLELWDARVEGTTLLRVLVTTDGEVEAVEVLESSGEPGLDTAAVNGARKMRFTPARRGDRRISVWAEVPVHFTTNPNARR